MIEVVKIINQLETTPGTNDKIAIIKNNSTNENFKKLLQYTYADDKMYGFSDKKLRKELDGFIKEQNTRLELLTPYPNGFALLDVLANSNINDSLEEKLTHSYLYVEKNKESYGLGFLQRI